jgi:hypothetical protein
MEHGSCEAEQMASYTLFEAVQCREKESWKMKRVI